jgi:hypothetical protein
MLLMEDYCAKYTFVPRLTYLNSTWYQVVKFPLERDRDEWLDQYVEPWRLNVIYQVF